MLASDLPDKIKFFFLKKKRDIHQFIVGEDHERVAYMPKLITQSARESCHSSNYSPNALLDHV